MAIFKKAAVAAAIVAAGCACPAQQQKFPLQPGEWEVSTTMVGAKEPIVLHVCLNDQLWTTALTQSPKCSISNLTVTQKGVSYLMDCPATTFEMKGKVEITFDGQQHMIGKGAVDFLIDGKSSSASTSADYRWKNSTCSPNDVNLKYKPGN